MYFLYNINSEFLRSSCVSYRLLFLFAIQSEWLSALIVRISLDSSCKL